MTRPTRLIGTIPVLTSGFVGYNPDSGVGDVIPPIDRVTEGQAFFPVAVGTDVGYTQVSDVGRGNHVIPATATLPATPTPGNMLVGTVFQRGGASAVWGLASDWNFIRREPAASGSSWPLGMYWRAVLPGDGAAWSCTSDITSGHAFVVAELEGVQALDEDAGSPSSTAAGTLSLTPVTSDPIVMVSAISAVDDSDLAFTPASGMTEVVDDHMEFPGDNGPQFAINYRVEDTPTGSYTLGSTYAGLIERGVIAASFVGVAGSVFYLPALNVEDDDDATFDYVTSNSQTTEALLVILELAYRIATATLRIGFEDSGAVTVSIEADNDPTFATAVEVASEAITGTGSFTAQDIDFAWSDTTAYQYYRVIVSTADNVRIYGFEMFGPSAADEPIADAHIADPTAAHVASAVSFTPAGTIAATNVQDAIEEVAAEAGSGSLTVDDGVTSVSPVDTIVFVGTGDATVEVTDDTGGQVTVTIDATAGGGAPDDAEYLVTAADSDLSAERVVDLGAYSLLTRRAAANTEDDHFNAGTLDAKWLAYTNANATTDLTAMLGWAKITTGAGSTFKLQAVPVGDWTIEAEVISPDATAAAFVGAEMIMTNGTNATAGTDARLVFGQANSLTQYRLNASKFVNNAFNAGYTDYPFTVPINHIFMRIVKSGTTYAWEWSRTGKTWQRFGSTAALGFTPTHFGFGGATGALWNYFLRY